MGKKHVRFTQLLEQRLGQVIGAKFVGKQLTPDVLREIRDDIRLQVNSIFNKSSHQLSPDALGWVANKFFETIKVNGGDDGTTLGELVVINEFKLADMPFSDIQLLKNLFDNTVVGAQLQAEYDRRTLA